MARVVEGNECVVQNREWYLAAYSTEGVPTSDHLKLRTLPLSLASDSIPDGHVAIETLFLSVDPYLRTRLTGTLDGLYIQQYQINQVFILILILNLLGSSSQHRNKYLWFYTLVIGYLLNWVVAIVEKMVEPHFSWFGYM